MAVLRSLRERVFSAAQASAAVMTAINSGSKSSGGWLHSQDLYLMDYNILTIYRR